MVQQAVKNCTKIQTLRRKPVWQSLNFVRPPMCFRWLYASVLSNCLEGRQCILATDRTGYVGRQTTDWRAGGSGQKKVCLRVLQETCAPLRSFYQDTRQDWLTPAQAGLTL
jgi:hypothetical protein